MSYQPTALTVSQLASFLLMKSYPLLPPPKTSMESNKQKTDWDTVAEESLAAQGVC